MQKYVVTKQNVHEIIGRMRKFFQSCSTCGMYDYSIRFKNMRRRDSRRYFSYPDPKNIYLSEEEYSEKYGLAIHVELPVRMDITYNSVIYFIGGNKIVIREYYVHDNTLSYFVDVYDRETIRRRYSVISHE